MSFNALIIAPWGYPPGWCKINYRVDMTLKGLGKVFMDKCVTCSSTLALASALKSSGKFSRVKAVIFGLDTAAQPGEGVSGEEFRRGVKDSYRKWLEGLIKVCEGECGGFLGTEDFSIFILPGKGVYNGWEYLGSLDAMFIKAFRRVVRELEGLGVKGTWIFIDVTHGINYQTMVTKYASLAAITHVAGSKGILKTYILNSEPLPSAAGLERCLRGVRPKPIDELSMLDVTRLYTALELISSIQSLQYLEHFRLSEAVKELRRVRERHLKELTEVLINKVLPAVKALRMGVAGPIFNGSNYSLGSYDLRLCRCVEDLEGIKVVDDEFIPRIDHIGRRVVYDDQASVWCLLAEVLAKVLKSLCDRYSLNSGNLVEFLKGLARLYGSVGLANLREIAARAGNELELMAYLWRSASDGVKVDAAVYYVLWRLMRRRELRAKELRDLVNEALKDVGGEPILRNFVAHAGVDFRTVKELILGSNGISSITYDNAKLQDVLRGLGIVGG